MSPSEKLKHYRKTYSATALKIKDLKSAMQTKSKDLGAALARMSKERGVSQQTLAKKVGVTYYVLNNALHGGQLLRPELADKILEVLDK